jgi:glucosinolate gamma-glutamyl hydrolase
VKVGFELTPEGKRFFPKTANEGILEINAMHHTEVVEPAHGFQPLLVNNEAFISTNGNILTFQAHPEIGSVFAEKLVREYFEKDLPENVMNEWLKRIHGSLDNAFVWSRIIQWIETQANRR